MSYTYYQAKNPATINITDEHVTESELPERLQSINSMLEALDSRTDRISRVGDKTLIPNLVTTSIEMRYNGPDSVMDIGTTYGQSIMNIWDNNKLVQCHGALTATNITSTNKTDIEALQDRTQNIEDTLTKVSYEPIANTTIVLGNLSTDKLNGNKIGASNEGFGYTNDAPYIPVCKANGITEICYRLDFHLDDATFRDYSVSLDNTAVNQLSIKNMTADTIGNLELGGLLVRPSSTVSCRLIANTASNMLWFNGAGVNTWVCDATSPVERWSTTRDNALAAFTRTTGMTHTPAVVEPQPAPAYTTFNHNLFSVECYSGRYHTNGTSSLPINSVASVSTWGAMRIVRTSLAQNIPCGYMFGRGNDPTNMPKNMCAMYYVSPTTDISKGEIRIGTETAASTSSTNCISFDTDTKETRLPGNLIVNGSVTDNGSKTITQHMRVTFNQDSLLRVLGMYSTMEKPLMKTAW